MNVRRRPAGPRRRGPAALAAGLVALGFATAAAAQTSGNAAPPLDVAAPVIDTEAPVGRPLWELGLGVAGLRLPDYRGSDQSRSYLLPLPYVVYRGKWLRADRDGARALLVDTPRFELDVSVAASVPTRSEDNDARRGMADLPGTVEIGPNANITLLRTDDRRAKLDLRLPLRAAFTLQRSPRSAGYTFSPNLNLDLARVAGGWNLGLLAGPMWGDSRNHALFYSVGEADAQAGRPAYRAPGGYAGWRALAATSRRFGNAWVGAFLRYDSLRGAVFESSPLVRERSGVSAGFGVSWVFLTSSERVAPSFD